tara:strand:+ start:9335 stop:10060 length:726 start_codon:yes stop_codon:yes gene_type:complete
MKGSTTTAKNESPQQTSKIKPESSSPQRVMDAIVNGIQKGRYVPGQRLIEADLTRELQMSRGPVREAFKRLAGEGVLVLSKNRGACVRAQTREEVNDTLVVLEALAGLAAKLAARHIDEGSNRKRFIAVFKDAVKQGEKGETQAFLESRRNLYDVLYEIGGNKELRGMVPRVQINLMRLQFQAFVSRKQHESQLKELHAIAESVLEGDPKKAERTAKFHLRRRRLSLTSLPDEAYAAANQL